VIAIGVILVLLVVLVTVFAVVASGTISSGIALTGLGISVSVSPLGLFLAGALSVILLGLGFALVSKGTRRTAGKRKELKTLRKEHTDPATRTAHDRAGGRTEGGAGGTGEGTRQAGAPTRGDAVGKTNGDRTDDSRAQRTDTPSKRVE
jgi:hypothetical protein